MTRINLFYLSPNNTGGWVTFTAHLMDALEAVGLTPVLRKQGNNTERKTRPFGYGRQYRNMSEADCYDLACNEPCLIVAAAKKFKSVTDELMSLGCHIVVHDPTELKNMPTGLCLMQDQCVVIRKNSLTIPELEGATFIRHPYTRQQSSGVPKTKLCVSTSRIDFDKLTHILLDANRLLKGDQKIDIRGFENRLYTRFKICPEYPEWEQSKVAYPRDKDAAFKILEEARFMADMSVIKGDGGGTQYTFLEAWDAGTIPIIHKDWIMEGDDMRPGHNCLTVRDGNELATMLQYNVTSSDVSASTKAIRDSHLRDLVQGGYESLGQHHPRVIGGQYRDFLNV